MNLISDLLYSIRLLRKTPAFTLVCLLVVTLGVGVAVSLYSLNKNFYFGVPSFPDGDRFTVINRVDPQTGVEQGGPLDMNGFVFNRIKGSSTSFSELGASRTVRATISDNESAELYMAAEIMPSLLALTGEQPALGRSFTSADADVGADPVVLVSHRLWQNYYVGDPEILGRVARINGNPFTIIGVMPENFSFPTTHQMWFPLSIPASAEAEGTVVFTVIGTLQPDVDREQASVELGSILSQIRSEYPGQFAEQHGMVSRYINIWTGSSAGIPLVMAVLALTIILLVSLNLSTLLFVRANARHQELAVRNALGASRWQNFRQVLTESLLICSVGSALGLALAEFITRLYELSVEALAVSRNSVLPFWIDFTPDASALMLTAGLMIIVWLLSGSLAARRASTSELSQALEGTKGATSRLGAVTMRIVVGVEIMFSVFLLILCTLFIFTMRDAINVDYGINTEDVVVANVSLSDQRYDRFESRQQYFNSLNSELLKSSEIQSVTATSALPGTFVPEIVFNLTEGEVANSDDPLQVRSVWVSEDYFSSLDAQLLAGREFESTDIVNGGSAVLVVDENFASSYWPNESALGKQVQLDRGEGNDWLTVIGVVPTLRQGFGIVADDPPPAIYLPFDSLSPRAVSLVMKTSGRIDLPTLRASIKTATLAIDRDIPITEILGLPEFLRMITGPFTLFANFLIGVALTTLFLSVVGIYGVISRSIVLRTSEIGIRRALGSSSKKIVSLFVKQGLRFFTVGAIFGGAAVMLIVNAMPTDMSNVIIDYLFFSIFSCFAIVGCLVFAASYLPARTAVAMEPGEALHYE
ncbi:MAG: hypothetical protein COB20_09890 [SAR86 cluster bacterium]|uniref:ABC transporter permease n=1 Tax=SAR86 cluster bacterium TaxID=2030880 RepID=A0A2A4X2J3_9GAMM|nr:MAG: hypothetical protein COB20_09890 [SAR86 cluster bacterium]